MKRLNENYLRVSIFYMFGDSLNRYKNRIALNLNGVGFDA